VSAVAALGFRPVLRKVAVKSFLLVTGMSAGLLGVQEFPATSGAAHILLIGARSTPGGATRQGHADRRRCARLR
jgi:hypothetical protein